MEKTLLGKTFSRRHFQRITKKFKNDEINMDDLLDDDHRNQTDSASFSVEHVQEESPFDDETFSSDESEDETETTEIDPEVAKMLFMFLWAKYLFSYQACEDIMNLINLISSKNIFPKRWTTFCKSNIIINKFTYYVYRDCDDGALFGPFRGKVKTFPEITCKCGTRSSVKEIEKGNYFIYNQLEDQLRILIQEQEENIQRNSKSNLNDIIDGKVHKTVVGSTDFSLTLATDGMPISKSSSRSVIPVFAYLNELPAKIRKDNPILLSIWEGKGKPNPFHYFKPLSDELKLLNHVNIS